MLCIEKFYRDYILRLNFVKELLVPLSNLCCAPPPPPFPHQRTSMARVDQTSFALGHLYNSENVDDLNRGKFSQRQFVILPAFAFLSDFDTLTH